MSRYDPKGRLHKRLAVSGGVDSTALALLCQRLQDAEPHLFNFQAFVVDHQARHGSSAEATEVINRLKNLGLPTQKLALSWPASTNPLEHPHFESRARTLRYRALGRACYAANIHPLLLAHHLDDQAETILMRITAGHTGFGLQGMKSAAGIPECFGVHGVHEQAPVGSIGRGKWQAVPGRDGVRIYRPFLVWPKQRLIETCKTAGVGWVEDPTNNDHRLSSRNVLRGLLKRDVLPTALRKESLLALREDVQREVTSLQGKAKVEFEKLRIQKIDMRSGTMEVAVKHSSEEDPDSWPAVHKTSEDDGRIARTATMVIERLVRMVTPCEHLDLGQMGRILTKFCGVMFAGDTNAQGEKGEQVSFTGAGMHWRHRLQRDDNAAVEHIWTLTREPFHRHETHPTCKWAKDSERESGENVEPDTSLSYGTWYLYDGRFWLRCWDASNQEIICRPMKADDLAPFLDGLSKGSKERLKALLKTAAPDRSRWTLPVLAKGEDGKVLALPTFGVQTLGSRGSLKWDGHFKRVEMPEALGKD